ncbi:hypothetical protein BGP83_15230 [Pseudomonas putida]|nr:hypothetical protein BGP83_15230 [Pseudomonas putida]
MAGRHLVDGSGGGTKILGRSNCLAQFLKAGAIPVGAGLPANKGEARAIHDGDGRNTATMKVLLAKTPPFLISDTDLKDVVIQRVSTGLEHLRVKRQFYPWADS